MYTLGKEILEVYAYLYTLGAAILVPFPYIWLNMCGLCMIVPCTGALLLPHNVWSPVHCSWVVHSYSDSELLYMYVLCVYHFCCLEQYSYTITIL